MRVRQWRGQHFSDQRPHHDLDPVPGEEARVQPFDLHRNLHSSFDLDLHTRYSTTDQSSVGLNSVINAASLAVSGPRSRSYTTPSTPVMKVIMPVSAYFTGVARMAKPPVILPFTM